MLRVVRTDAAGQPVETVEIPGVVEAAGAEAIDAYTEADVAGRAAQCAALEATEHARIAAATTAFLAAESTEASVIPTAPDELTTRRRKDRASTPQE